MERYEFEKLSDVPVLEEETNEDNVLVESGGKVRRLPKNKLGKVKTVNGEEPDENGNIEVETTSSWEELEGKPFEKRKIISEELPSLEVGTYCLLRGFKSTNADNDLKWENLQKSRHMYRYVIESFWNGMSFGDTSIESICINSDDGVNSYGLWNDYINITVYIVVNRSLLSEELQQKFTDNGVWVIIEDDTVKELFDSMVFVGYLYTQIHPEHMPDNVPVPKKAKVGQTVVVKAVNQADGRPMEWECVDFPTGGVKSWNDLEDKPFEETIAERVLFEVNNPTISNNTYTSEDYYAWEKFGSPLLLYINDKVIKGECVNGAGEARFDFEDGSYMYAYDLHFADDVYENISYIKITIVENNVKPLDEKFIPYVVKTEQQDLEQSQQMQARANLGLPYVRYRKDKIAYVAMAEGGWNGEYSWKPYVYQDDKDAPNSIQMEVIDGYDGPTIFDQELQMQYKVDAVGNEFYAGFWWYGNLNLITDELDSDAKFVITQLGLSETKYSDVPFVYYGYSPEQYGWMDDNTTINRFKLIFSDELTPSDYMYGYAISIFDADSEGIPVYTPLEEEYLPKIAWEKLEDKPFGELIDEVIFEDEMTSGSSKKLIRPIISEAEYYININGWEYTAHSYPGGMAEDYKTLLRLSTDQDEGFIIYISEDTISLYANEDGQSAYIYIEEKGADFTKIDEKYLPNNIPKIKTAEVGQTLVVKAVDERGKPTEWEAVDVNDTNLPFTVITKETHPEYFYQGICDLRLLPYFNCYLIKSLRLKYGEGANDYLDCGTTRYNDHGVFLVASLSQTFYFLSNAIHFNSSGDKSMVYRLTLDANREYDNLEYASLTTTYGKI